MKFTRHLFPLMLGFSLLTGTAYAQTDVETSTPTGSNTQVEIHNEAPDTPAQAPVAPAPNVDIDMPDVNVAPPANNTNTTRETVTERSSVVVNDADDTDVDNGNVWMMVLFAIIAIFLVGMIAMAASRRSTVS